MLALTGARKWESGITIFETPMGELLLKIKGITSQWDVLPFSAVA